MDTISVWKYEEQPERILDLAAVSLSKPQRAILEALGVFQFLTAEQLTRLLYKPTSRTYVQRHLLELVKGRYLTTLTPPKQTRFGSAPYVYTLTGRGRSFLASEGQLLDTRFRPSEVKTRKGGPLLHTLAVNEVLLQAYLLERETEDAMLLDFVTEREWNRQPLRVTLPDRNGDKQVSLSPDLWVNIGHAGFEYRLCIEVNLTPVEQKRWRRKVDAYLHCLPSYKARFGNEGITVVVIVASATDFPRSVRAATTSSPASQDPKEVRRVQASLNRRLTDLLDWTEAELRHQQVKEEAANLFSCTALSLSEVTPKELFLAPRFFSPFEEHPHALVASGGGEAAGGG